MPRLPLTTERLALFGTLLATFGELHPACDHWVQGSKTASRKRLYGEDLVHADGTPADPDSTRPTMTTSTLGRRAVACHVISLGLEGRVDAVGATFSQLSGMTRSVPCARQVSWMQAATGTAQMFTSSTAQGASTRSDARPWRVDRSALVPDQRVAPEQSPAQPCAG